MYLAMVHTCCVGASGIDALTRLLAALDADTKAVRIGRVAAHGDDAGGWLRRRARRAAR